MATKKKVAAKVGNQEKAAFEKVEARARALPDDKVRFVRLDPHAAASVALKACAFARTPKARATFGLVSKELFDPAVIDDAAALGLAMTYARARQNAMKVASRAKKLPDALKASATELKARMMLLTEFMFHDMPEQAKEVALIKKGTGYLDLAQDLQRLGLLYETHEELLSTDRRVYRATDAEEARRLAEQILRGFDGPKNDDWADITARLWTLFDDAYAEIRRVAEFVFKNDAASLAKIPSLYLVVRAKAAKSPGSNDVGATPPAEG